MSELHWLTAGEASRGFAKGTLSPVDLARALLARIERLDPRLNVFRRIEPEAVLAAARQAETAIARGEARGPLHGIPVAIKDIIDVAGSPTSCYSKIMPETAVSADAAAVRLLREAGAIIIGKVATYEFAIGGPSFDLPFPPAFNPWNTACHTGGSSSGSAAGLAAGFFPLAIGTDTGGSIRSPANACGIVGVKPTYGRVSRQGVFPLAFTLDHVGSMARSVADAALLLDAMTEPSSGKASNPGHVASAGSLRGLKVGFVRHFHEADMIAASEVGEALEQTAQVLAAQGAEIRAVTLPKLEIFAAVGRLIYLSEAWSIHAAWLRERPEDYGEYGRRRLLGGAFLSAGDYVDAQRRRTELAAATQAVLRDVDVLLTANAMDPPCRMDDPVETARTFPRQARAPFNLTGHPAIALPAGQSAQGLPLGVQFVGRHGEEATMFRVAAAFERATDWHLRRPDLGEHKQ